MPQHLSPLPEVQVLLFNWWYCLVSFSVIRRWPVKRRDLIFDFCVCCWGWLGCWGCVKWNNSMWSVLSYTAVNALSSFGFMCKFVIKDTPRSLYYNCDYILLILIIIIIITIFYLQLKSNSDVSLTGTPVSQNLFRFKWPPKTQFVKGLVQHFLIFTNELSFRDLDDSFHSHSCIKG